MNRPGKWSPQATIGVLLIVVGLVAAATLLALTIPSSGPLHPNGSSSGTGQVLGAALGERIFLTGANEIRRSIPRSGVTGMMGSAVACANCHGSDARGGTVRMMMGQVEAPDIRWSTLTSPVAASEEGDKPFDADLFFRAVTQGMDPADKLLQAFMPRWSLTRAESDALVEYLKTR
jgi:mono/diheme cytochrome c family protein